MRRAQAHELNEDAVPALVIKVSEQRLREMFPVRFSSVDSLAEPEPSIAALVELGSGGHCVVAFGLVTHRATISFPETADVSQMASSLFRETGIRKSEVQWIAERARVALQDASADLATKRATAPGAVAGGGSSQDLRDDDLRQLRALERHLLEQLYKIRFQPAAERVNKRLELRLKLKLHRVRRKIARIATPLNERKRKTS